ncbi:MAG: tRNA pseudouridine(55) synthase TruB [Desulfobacteraceae bacterium]|nr:MAG: tRNA pseudouridine(55) synthase TruB [Desulfobacteraceae bacterium]
MKTTRGIKTQARFTGDGVLIVDKPAGFTSHDVVQKAKRKLGAAKVGHSGTLDPFATGVLILLINGATKLAPFLADHEKTYLFNVSFGVETDTQDSTGKVVARQSCEPLQEREIRAACDAFIGEIEQTVPRYSAVRVKGQRLYHLARRGVEVTPPNRKVEIKALSFCELRWPEATFEVTCSKGTYVRSLGVDLARHLNCSGHVSQLRRLASGGFNLRQAVTLEQLEESMARGELHQLLMTSAQALDCYTELRVSPLDAKRIRQGFTLDSIQFLDPGSSPGWPAGTYKVLDPDNNLVAMVSKAAKVANDRHEGGVTFKTLRVFGAV